MFQLEDGAVDSIPEVGTYACKVQRHLKVMHVGRLQAVWPDIGFKKDGYRRTQAGASP